MRFVTFSHLTGPTAFNNVILPKENATTTPLTFALDSAHPMHRGASRWVEDTNGSFVMAKSFVSQSGTYRFTSESEMFLEMFRIYQIAQLMQVGLLNYQTIQGFSEYASSFTQARISKFEVTRGTADFNVENKQDRPNGIWTCQASFQFLLVDPTSWTHGHTPKELFFL